MNSATNTSVPAELSASSIEECMQITALESYPELVDRIAQLFVDGDNFKCLGFPKVCEILAVGQRTLQRRLSLKGSRFHRIKDRVRMYYAVRYLLLERCSVEETATRLGYTDRTSFTSGFRRWTGMPPASFVSALRHGRMVQFNALAMTLYRDNIHYIDDNKKTTERLDCSTDYLNESAPPVFDHSLAIELAM